MKSANKRSKVIGKAEARAAAEQLLAGLATGGVDGEAIGHELCTRYTPGSRLHIFEEMTEQLRRGAATLAADSLGAFLGSLADGVKAPEAPDHVTGIINLAVAAFPDLRPPLAAEFLLDVVARQEPTHEGPRRLFVEDDELRLVSRLEAGPAVLVMTLRLAEGKQQITLPFLRRGQRALLPLIGRRAALQKASLAPGQAAEILDILGHVRTDQIPEELLLVCPRLVDLARGQGRAFLDTPPGQALRELLPSMTGGSPLVAAESASPAKEATDQGVPHWEILFERAVMLVRTQLREQERGSAQNQNRLRVLQEERDTAREAEQRASEHLRVLTHRLDRAEARREQLEQERKGLEQQLQTLQEKASRWQGEASRRESELSAGFEDRERSNLEKWRRLLVGSLRDLHGYIQDLLAAYRGEKKVRQVGLVFDQLQRDLIELLKLVDEPRLPRELLTREPKPEGNDERPGN